MLTLSLKQQTALRAVQLAMSYQARLSATQNMATRAPPPRSAPPAAPVATTSNVCLLACVISYLADMLHSRRPLPPSDMVFLLLRILLHLLMAMLFVYHFSSASSLTLSNRMGRTSELELLFLKTHFPHLSQSTTRKISLTRGKSLLNSVLLLALLVHRRLHLAQISETTKLSTTRKGLEAQEQSQQSLLWYFSPFSS